MTTKKFILFFILLFVINFSYSVEFENVSGEEFGLDEINNRKTYQEIANNLRNKLNEMSEELSDLKGLSAEAPKLHDLNTEEFSNKKLSEQLQLFQDNYKALNDFTIKSLQGLQDNNSKLSRFYSLNIEAMSIISELIDECDRVQASIDEDLNLALSELRKSLENTDSLKQELSVARSLAVEADKQLRKAKNARIFWQIATPIAFVVGGICGSVIIGVSK